MPNPYHSLPVRSKNFCEYGGLFGVLLTLTCLIQHFIVTRQTSVTEMMIPGYIIALAGFALLGFQQWYAIFILIVSALYVAFIEYKWMTNGAFSLVIVLLFIYHVIIVVFAFTENLPALLKQKYLAQKAEEEEWRGKI